MAHFAGWSEVHRADIELMTENRDAILRAMEHGVALERWPEVLRIARAAEDADVLTGHWKMWEQVGQTALKAAREIGDQSAEARALHQLGTRALLWDDPTGGESMLREALRIRERLGDEWGADVTRQNLRMLLATTVRRRATASSWRVAQ